MKEIIKNEVENIFNTLSSYFNLKSGDITPMQSIQVDEFKLMLEEWIKQNMGTNTEKEIILESIKRVRDSLNIMENKVEKIL